MGARVLLKVVQGPRKAKTLLFEGHETYVFGRGSECYEITPECDKAVGRHHFMLEVNAPDVRLRDLGSLNGTYVNGKKYGGRRDGETPEEAAGRAGAVVDIRDGDLIQAGMTVFKVTIDEEALCSACGGATGFFGDGGRPHGGGHVLCEKCFQDLERRAGAPGTGREQSPGAVVCQVCKRDVTAEAGHSRRGDYICSTCRETVESDPSNLLLGVLEGVLKSGAGGGPLLIRGYEIGREIGRGPLSAVYLGTRSSDNATFAIKMMLSRVAVDESMRRVFEREVGIISHLKHPNIVEFVEHGSAGSAFYFVLEHCDGGNLRRLMESGGGRVRLDVAWPIMLQALEGVACAHDKRVVHRCLKPENILLCRTPYGQTAKVGDFGLAKSFRRAGLGGMTATSNEAASFPFMAREQVTGSRLAGASSDVWSIAATFYYMITGRHPRRARDGEDPLAVLLNGDVVPMRECDAAVPQPLAAILDRALDGDPARRYQSAGEMLEALKLLPPPQVVRVTLDGRP